MRLRHVALCLAATACLGCNAFAGAESELPGSGGSSSRASTGASGGTATSGGKGGASGASTTSSTGGSTTTGTSMTENCTNGIDDNGDGRADCDDPECSDFACVDAPPAGWSLPGAFYYDIPSTVPACPTNDPTQKAVGNGDLSFDSDSCETCTCGGRTGQSCTATSVYLYTAADCAGNGLAHNAPANHCATGFFNGQSVEAKTNYVSGSCMPIGGSISNSPNPTFSKVGKVCAPERVGKCSKPNSVCAPKVGGEFGSSVCISQVGDLTCPSGYPNKTTLYASTTDTRGCSMCTCTLPANDCTSSVTYYQGGNGDCGYSDPPGTLTMSTTGVCKDLTGVESAYVGAISWPSATTQCSPLGGEPTGTVIGKDPTTVCCQ